MNKSIDLPPDIDFREGTTIVAHSPLTDDRPHIPVAIKKFRRLANGWVQVGMTTYAVICGNDTVFRTTVRDKAIAEAQKRNGQAKDSKPGKRGPEPPPPGKPTQPEGNGGHRIRRSPH